METNGKEIKKIIATTDNRRVWVQDVTDGKAFVQPLDFDPNHDEEIYYHGWTTEVKNLHAVTVDYTDGSREYLGDPRPKKESSLNYIVEKDRTFVL